MVVSSISIERSTTSFIWDKSREIWKRGKFLNTSVKWKNSCKKLKRKSNKSLSKETLHFKLIKCSTHRLCLKLESKGNKKIESSMTWSLDRTLTAYGFRMQSLSNFLKTIASQKRSCTNLSRHCVRIMIARLSQRYSHTLCVLCLSSKNTSSRGKMSGSL